MDYNYMVWVWLGVIVLAAVLEAITMQLASVWFIGGGILALLVAAISGPIWLQITLFIIVSIVLLVFTRPILVDKLKIGQKKTNADALVGKTCIVTEHIDNLKALGRVEINGVSWAARSTDEDITFKKGEEVMITEISGVKLIVKKENK